MLTMARGAQVVGETETFLVVKGWHKYKPSDMEGQMAMADVIVVNYALHYHGDEAKKLGTMEEYEIEMRRRDPLRTLNSQGTLWRLGLRV